MTRLNAKPDFPRGVADWWQPVLVGLLAALGCVLLWRALERDGRSELGHETAAVAEGVRRELEAHIDGQTQTLRNLATFWARFGPPPRTEWRESAELLIRQQPGLARLRWFHEDGQVWSAVATEAPLEMGADVERERALEVAREGREEVIGPRNLEGGGVAYRLILPIASDATTRGALSAEVRVGRMLDAVFQTRASSYAIAVSWAGAEIYRRGVPASRIGSDWIHRESVELPIGASWTVTVAPTAERIDASAKWVPRYLLFAGLLISALLALLVRMWQLAGARAEALADANRRLREGLVDARGSEANLRRLNEALEERVALRTHDLEDAVSELEAFNYSVSHDLRSPLGAILNFAEILREDYRDALDEEGRMFVERIIESARSASALMDGLLSFSRLGREELKPEEIDVGRLVRDVFAESQLQSPKARLEVGALPPAWADERMIRLVFTNLIANALKFSASREEPRITVSGRVEDDEVVYTVSDNGVGFDMRFASKLFRVFQRLHSTEEFEGHGVGLALVARIVRRHGGRVHAEGIVDQGASFSFSFKRGPEP